MPSKSGPQHRMMEGIAHGWRPSNMKHAPSKEVAQKFVQADKKTGKTFSTAGMAKAMAKPRKRDPEAEVMERGGYSPGHGVGSG